MIVLVVVPDYVSHWYPLSAAASALRARGHTVVVAATRRGMIPTLRYQAERRRHDLLWQPRLVAERIRDVVELVAPDAVLVDQLAFGATAALRGLGVPFFSFLPGHPCQLPTRGQPFGYPALRPPAFSAPAGELASLKQLCTEVGAEFTAAYNAVTASLDPAATPLDDAFAAGGTLGTLVNYPAQLGAHGRRLPHARFLGSCVRAEASSAIGRRLGRAWGARPRAFVSLGSFLSARSDVLVAIAAALRALGWDAVIAAGATDPSRLGPVPSRWVVRAQLPQVAALEVCDVVVCHGGNNTVTEALTAGIPVLAAPFSTDQFAGAEDLRSDGLGDAIDPNAASVAEIADRLASLVDGDAACRAAALGAELREARGAETAADVVEAGLRVSRPLPEPPVERRSPERAATT